MTSSYTTSTHSRFVLWLQISHLTSHLLIYQISNVSVSEDWVLWNNSGPFWPSIEQLALILWRLHAPGSIIQEIEFNVTTLLLPSKEMIHPWDWAALDACFAALGRDQPTLRKLSVLMQKPMMHETELKRRKVWIFMNCFPWSREIAIFHVRLTL